jgi:hypothetical protein
MKKYLFIILLVAFGFGQDSSSIEKNDKKVRCRECFLPMRETISAYICRDNHMRIEKTDLKVDQEGNFIVSTSEELMFEEVNQSRMNQVSSLEDHLSRSGDNLRLYYFKTLVGFALVTAGTMWQIDLALKGKSQITPYLVTGAGFIYHMSALKNIEKSGIELKRASRAIEKSKNIGKEN